MSKKFLVVIALLVGMVRPAVAQTRSAPVFPKGDPTAAEVSPIETTVNSEQNVTNSPIQKASWESGSPYAASLSINSGEMSSGRVGRSGLRTSSMGEIVYQNSPEMGEEIVPQEGMALDLSALDGTDEISDSCGNATCSECSDTYCGACEWPGLEMLGSWGHRNLAIFGGVHGFKGARDRGLNGNFGFQEGLNFGAPLGDPWGCGYQLGFQALQDNISGNQISGSPTADRHQYFATAGIFRRAEVGAIQWGVVFDYLHDTYCNRSDLKQIRSETGWLLTAHTEIGYSGAYGIGGDSSTYSNERVTVISRLDPTDQFVAYIRRYFDNGGDGRIYGGVTGKGDGLLGGDVWIPLNGSWAMQNSFAYLIPKQGRGAGVDDNGAPSGGQIRESWGVAINLVWYPGRSARCVGESCYRSVLNVADNGQFMVTENFSR